MAKETFNLAHALGEDPLCLGVAWRVRPGEDLWNYQNDNDLGLDLEGYDEAGGIEAERLTADEAGHYIIIDEAFGDMEDGAAAPLNTVVALLKECHPTLFKLTPAEQKLCDDYWGRF